MYYYLASKSDRLEYGIEVIPSSLRSLFLWTNPILQDVPLQTVIIKTLRNLEDVFWLGSRMICSARFVELLKKVAVDGFQTFSASIEAGKSKLSNGEYLVVHVFKVVPCANLEKCVFTKEFGKSIAHLDTLIIDEEKVPSDAHLFHFDPMSGRLLASEALRTAAIAAKITGIQFVPLDGRYFPL